MRAPALARGRELVLLLWAFAIAAAGSLAVTGARTGTFAPSALAVPTSLLAVALALHAVLIVRRSRGDQVLLPLAVALAGIGLVLVDRLAPSLLLQQVTWVVVGAGAFVAVLLVPRELGTLARFKYLWALFGFALLFTPLLPVVGQEVNGARIWIRLGPASFSPWEAVKLILVVFFAAYLEEFREVIARPRRIGPLPVPPVAYLAPIFGAWAVAMLTMVAGRDLGATLLFFGIFLAMLWLATGEAAYVVYGAILLFAGALVAVEVFPHVAARVEVWQRPFAEDLRFGASYQLVQGLFALGAGGVLGAGFGSGLPERIPIVWSDFVFDAFAEETGFAGALALLGLVLLLVYRGLAIALRAPTPFLQLMAGGLSFAVALQTLVIVGGNAALIPLTGLTLPFVAYGGSSLVTNFALVGLLVRISDRGTGGRR
ncbi:MAG: FtsW/RodA/SpoVE family cell cycle protein [Chloroflexi bacterium]|nr:FtsW/RodA/SpoVE family cell cycle protein [Chloroflexota bacterium]